MGETFVSGDFAFVSESKARRLKANTAVAGDVVFTQRGTLGQLSIVPSGPYRIYLISQSQMKVSVDTGKYDAMYLLQYFLSQFGQKTILDSAIQTGVPHTNLGILKAYNFPAPRLPEQRAIAAALGDVDALLAGLDRLIAKKRDLKQAAMQNLLTGQTRLPGFSGEWAIKNLGEVARFFKGKGLPKSEILDSGTVPCVHYGELFTFYGVTITEVSSKTHERANAFLSSRHDVLMPTSDVTPRGLAKASCLSVDDVVLGGDILVIRPDADQVDGAFLAAQIRFREQQVLSFVTGSTVFHLYAADMRKFEFPLPEIIEQTAISEILSGLDDDIAAQEALRTKTASLKQAMMQELLTGNIRLPIGDAADA
jgi:type I restriction enzyme S subunit